MNLANVRSAIAAMLALAVLALATVPPGARRSAEADRRAVIAVLPYGTTVEQIARSTELAPGRGQRRTRARSRSRRPSSTSSQGNRVNEDLYDGDLPRLYLPRRAGSRRRLWERTVTRAESAPADIVPGLLASTLEAAGVPVAAEADSGLATLIAVDRDGAVRIAEPDACESGCGPGLSLVRARVSELDRLAAALGPDDLLIAIAAGARAEQELLPAGIAGEGFEGNLTSSSTRTDGVVTTTDLAPTVLDRLGVEVPDEVNGSEITSGSERDPEAVADLQERLDTRPSREPVVLLPLGVWLLLSGLAALIWRRRGARVALRLLGLACAWAPLMLLVAAAVDASTLASALLLGVGLGRARRWRPTALLRGCAGPGARLRGDASAPTRSTWSPGSPLTALSVLGPNPGYGVRFFGIGNELEAVLTTLTLVGTGAALATRPGLERRTAARPGSSASRCSRPPPSPRAASAPTSAPRSCSASAGRPPPCSRSGSRRRRAVAVVAARRCAGARRRCCSSTSSLGGAHLSRSVLGAGEAGDVLDVARPAPDADGDHVRPPRLPRAARGHGRAR